MYKHLTKGEKKKKLKQARKRAIVWSAQEQLRKALKIQSNSETETETEEIKKPAAKLPPTGSRTARAPRSLLTPTAPSPIQNQYTTVPTIAEIESTLQSLYQQRQHLNTTISVLQQQLLYLHSKEDEDEDYEFE